MMPLFSDTQKTSTLASLFGLIFILFGWFVLSLALSGLFLFPLIVSGAILSAIIAIFIGWRLFLRAPVEFKSMLLILVVCSALLGYISEPTLFSGRDQGSISEAAFRLAQNGQLAFATDASTAFFNLYGEGTALNFPGFAYTQACDLLTQFPLGYTAWLGSFILLFGIHGIAVGNSLLFFLFLFSFSNILRVFAGSFYTWCAIGLTLLSFLPTWFAKITVSENLAVFLFTFLVWHIIVFIREGKFIAYTGVFLSVGLFVFTRIEGLAFLALTLMLLFWNQHTRSIWKTYPWKSIVIPGIVFFFFFLRDFFINLPYYKMIGKAAIKFTHQLGTGNIVGDIVTADHTFAIGPVFLLYGLFVLFALGFLGMFICAKEKHYILLIPVFIALPTFLYLFDPNISLDHPWMLRRYLFSLFPTFLFSAVMGIALLLTQDKNLPVANPHGKRLFFASIIILGLALLQYPAWSTGILFAENRTLLNQVATLSQEFSDKDLVLVDRNVTSDGFAMLTGPAQFLYGKNMVYFFNPTDIATLDTAPFARIYLLVPEGDQMRYVSVFGHRLVFNKTITFTQERFEYLSLEENAPLRLPEKILYTTNNLLFQIY